MIDDTNTPQLSTKREIPDARSTGFADRHEERDGTPRADALPADAGEACLAGQEEGHTSVEGGDDRPKRGNAKTETPKANLINRSHYFGACPRCAETDGYFNVGRNHWFVCDTHMLAWCAGSNLFSGWRDEDEAVWTANAEKLEKYQEVEPLLSIDR